MNLLKLIEKINKKEVDIIVVLYKDRLLRFGFELVEYFAKLNNVSIEVLNRLLFYLFSLLILISLAYYN